VSPAGVFNLGAQPASSVAARVPAPEPTFVLRDVP
jgi:hypothetical protein